MKITIDRDGSIVMHIYYGSMEVGSISYNKNGSLLFTGKLDESVKALLSEVLRKLTNSRIYLVIGVNFVDHGSWIHEAFLTEIEADDKAESLQDLADTVPSELRTHDLPSTSKVRDYHNSEIEYFVTSTKLNILSE